MLKLGMARLTTPCKLVGGTGRGDARSKPICLIKGSSVCPVLSRVEAYRV